MGKSVLFTYNSKYCVLYKVLLFPHSLVKCPRISAQWSFEVKQIKTFEYYNGEFYSTLSQNRLIGGTDTLKAVEFSNFLNAFEL